MLFSAGDCPVCSSSGIVAVLIDLVTGTPVFYCPMCGVAWRRVPDPGRLDEVAELGDLAAGGVRLPNDRELASLAASGVVLSRISFDAWADELAPILAAS